MRAEHLEILVEERSMEAFLTELLPRLVGTSTTYNIHTHQGKGDLLGKLGPRLRGYSKWLPSTARIAVVVDRDALDCADLKQQMETAATSAGLLTRSTCAEAPWQVVNRIAIEELEAWYFADWDGVRTAYPKAPQSVPRQAPFRFSDAISGGTWEAFERIMKKAGYFEGGLRKMEAAQAIGKHLDPDRCSSPSFAAFRNALREATS